MAEWQDQLNTILSDPDAMAQIAALAQSISGSPNTAAESDPGSAHAAASFDTSADAEKVQSLLQSLDPELMGRLVPLMQQMNRPESSQTTAFLQALRPFLSVKRRDKVERAAQLARLIHLGKTFFTSQGAEAGHV